MIICKGEKCNKGNRCCWSCPDSEDWSCRCVCGEQPQTCGKSKEEPGDGQ